MWEVEFTDEFEAWWNQLTVDQQEALAQRVELLAQRGPSLRRPVVGEIKGSRHDPQMKELIASVGHAALRVLFIFDPRRTAILLLGGDKAEGERWNEWYRTAIPEADRLYDEYLDELREEGLIPDGRT